MRAPIGSEKPKAPERNFGLKSREKNAMILPIPVLETGKKSKKKSKQHS
jgi:hypothetical protein